MDTADCIVIGAGVVGLAVARLLALTGRDVIVLEAQDCIGSGISSRNSEVIHAGIYYPAASLKAALCVSGRKQLYQYCAEHAVPVKRCGKLIVATQQQQHPQLLAIQDKARINGVDDLVLLDKAAAIQREPDILCSSALWSPSTGIIDSHAYMLALQADLENAGSMIVFNSKVTAGSVVNGLPVVNVESEGSTVNLAARTVVNCAGLGSDKLAQAIEGIDLKTVPSYHYARGNYFNCVVKSPFSSLIYPVPNEYGLGVHVTHDIAGQLRFGPDVEWVDEINYEVDPKRSEVFYDAIRSYWPELPDNSLLPAYSGIRPKIQGKGSQASDFVIQDESAHGVPGLVNLFGIESPGLTSSLALADHVCNLIGRP